MGGTYYMRHWKAKNKEPEPTLSTGDADEAPSTELESQTVKVDTDKPSGKGGVTGPVQVDAHFLLNYSHSRQYGNMRIRRNTHHARIAHRHWEVILRADTSCLTVHFVAL